MHLIEVIVPILSLHTGVVQLSEHQARLRAHALQPLGEGLYQILSTVGFKRGETLGWGGEMSRALACQVNSAVIIVQDREELGSPDLDEAPLYLEDEPSSAAEPEVVNVPEPEPTPAAVIPPFGRKPKGRR